MTETCGITSLENPKEESPLSGSTGTLVSGVESQIVSIDTSKPLPPKQSGEIWLRGPNMMQGGFFYVMFLLRFLLLTGHMLISQFKISYHYFFFFFSLRIHPVVKMLYVTNFLYC